jgi:poly(A) polymerase
MPKGPVEVATFRRDGPYTDGRHPDYVEYVDEIEDARRRDFTVNALFYDPEANRVLDYVGGRDDMDAGILRAVGESRQRFEEDHLRLLRAVRFAARLGYVIHSDTLTAIEEMAGLIVKTSAERIRDEIVKTLTEGHARRAFGLLDETGLLEHVLPEVAAMKGVAQPEEFHPEGDVWQHTLAILDLLHTDSTTLALAALLHDVGKPVTQTFEDRIRFNNHDKVGARMAESMGRRLRLSNEDIARIAWIIESHMRVAAIPDMRESRRKRFVRHDAFPELFEVCRLDCLASHGDMSTIDWVERYITNLPPEQLKPAPLLTGNDLIEMGYVPGPLFSEILTAVEDAQLDGEVESGGQARKFVRSRWPSAS